MFSCSPVREISIEILEPAEITIPPNIQSIAFINMSYMPWLSMDMTDTSRWVPHELYIIDTILTNKLFLGLFDALNTSPLFNLEIPSVMQLRRSELPRFPESLTAEEIRQICDSSRTDGLICLEGYSIIDSLDYSHYYYVDDIEEYSVVLLLRGKILWRIYDGLFVTMIDEFISFDSINWTTYSESIWTAVDELPEMVNAIREYGYQAGYKFGRRISPAWYQARRFYYRRGSKDMKTAAEFAKRGEWDKGVILWKNSAKSERNVLAAKASFNVALYYEMKDLLISAIDWAKKSDELNKDNYTRQYIEILEQRKLNKLKLQQQIPEENNQHQ